MNLKKIKQISAVFLGLALLLFFQNAVSQNADSIELVYDDGNPNVSLTFNESTTINYQLMKPGRISLNIIDLRGKFIQKLIEDFQQAGAYRISWNGYDSHYKKIASGIYLYELKVVNKRIVRKLIFVR